MVLVALVILGLLGGALGASLLAGYYIRDRQMTPLASFIPRVERKLAKMAGEPSQIAKDLAHVTTTFVDLKGRVMRPPVENWISGGAMAVRGGDLLVMNRLGDIFVTDGEAPLTRLTDLSLPENGFAAYQRLAETEAYRSYNHKFRSFRYNDLTWIESGDLSGFAVSYTFFDETEACYGSRVAWAEVDRAEPLARVTLTPTDWEVIFETTPCLELNPTFTALDGIMAGGRMAFQAPSTLYFGSGEYHLDGIHTYDVGIQDDDTSYGKVIAIDLLAGTHRTVSKGHRNLQGVALDKQGRLWVTEHAIRGGDELNLVREGANYGWPEVSLGTLYSGQPFENMPYGRHTGFAQPVFAWLPSAAISSLAVIDGIDESWDGDLLAGSLSSPELGNALFHIRIEGSRVVFVERIPLGERVRYIQQFGDRIAVWMDSNDLVLFDVVRRADPLEAALAWLDENHDAETADRVKQVIASCNECHGFGQGENRTGPTLAGLVGRTVAGIDKYAGYSEALRSVGGTWTHGRLSRYLADPDAFAPGGYMPQSGLDEGPALDALIGVLERAGQGELAGPAY